MKTINIKLPLYQISNTIINLRNITFVRGEFVVRFLDDDEVSVSFSAKFTGDNDEWNLCLGKFKPNTINEKDVPFDAFEDYLRFVEAWNNVISL